MCRPSGFNTSPAEYCTDEPSLLGEPRPSVALISGFEGASLTFTLDCRVARFTDQWAVQDGLRRRILRRFMEEGVEMAAAVADGHGQSLACSL